MLQNDVYNNRNNKFYKLFEKLFVNSTKLNIA